MQATAAEMRTKGAKGHSALLRAGCSGLDEQQGVPIFSQEITYSDRHIAYGLVMMAGMKGGCRRAAINSRVLLTASVNVVSFSLRTGSALSFT